MADVEAHASGGGGSAGGGGGDVKEVIVIDDDGEEEEEEAPADAHATFECARAHKPDKDARRVQSAAVAKVCLCVLWCCLSLCLYLEWCALTRPRVPL